MGSVAMLPLSVCFVVLCLLECTAAAENWQETTNNVCFKAKGRKPGSFKIPDSGFLQGIRLTHVSGGVSCNTRSSYHMSKFGCYGGEKGKVGVSISTDSDKILFPTELKSPNHFHSFVYSGGNAANSTTVTFYDDLYPTYFEKDSTLKLWYNEDYANRHTGDNSDIDNCVKVSFLFAE